MMGGRVVGWYQVRGGSYQPKKRRFFFVIFRKFFNKSANYFRNSRLDVDSFGKRM